VSSKQITATSGAFVWQDVGLRTDILYQAFLAEDNDKRRVATQFEVQVKAVEAAIRFEQRLAA
jgi:hypothetical protein